MTRTSNPLTFYIRLDSNHTTIKRINGEEDKNNKTTIERKYQKFIRADRIFSIKQQVKTCNKYKQTKIYNIRSKDP